VTDRHADLAHFHASFADEILAKRDRLRSLIGGAHWPSDGAYKEGLLRDAVKRVVPSGLEVAHGFLLKPDRTGTNPSGQLDLLIYDGSRRAPEFKDGDFACVVAGSARGVGEIKTRWTKKTLEEAVDQLADATLMAREEELWNTSPTTTFTSMLIGTEQRRHGRKGKLHRNGRLAIAKAFAQGYKRLFPHGLGDSVRMDEDCAAHYGWPSVACSLSGVPWVAMGMPTPQRVGETTWRIPTVHFYDPMVVVDGVKRNLALQMTLALLRYKLDPPPTQGGAPAAWRQGNRLDWAVHRAVVGKPVALVPATDDLTRVFGNRVDFIEMRNEA